MFSLQSVLSSYNEHYWLVISLLQTSNIYTKQLYQASDEDTACMKQS